MNPSPSRSAAQLLRVRLALAAILLLAFALRLWGLDQHNIWWDEGLSAWAARLPVPRILDWTAHDVHPPLHFLIQRGWWLLAGEGEWAMRFISALAGALAVAAVYPLAAALGGKRAGLLAALFLALSAFAVTWSQELRMYVWGSLWASLALYGALAWWKTRRVRWLLLYVAAAAAGLWTLYLFVAVLLVANLAFLVYGWRVYHARNLTGLQDLTGFWIAAQLAVLALFAPWLAYALPRMMSWSSAEPYAPAFFARLYATVLATGVAENIDPWLLPTLIVFALLVAGVAALLTQRKSPLQAAGLTMLALGVLLPAAMVYALTALPGRQFYVPRLAPRYFLPLAATFYALLGWGLVALGRRTRIVTVAGAGIVAAVGVAGLLALLPGRVATDQYVSLVHTLQARELSGDAVLLYPDEDWPLFAARYPGRWEKVPAGMSLTPENADALLTPVWQAADGLWVVMTPRAQESDPEGLARGWLDARAQAVRHWDFGETKLSLYARTAERAEWIDELGLAFFGVANGDFLAGSFHKGAFVPLRRYATGDALRITVYWLNRPEDEVKVELRGPTPRAVTLPPPPLTKQGRTGSLAVIPLTPNMQAGAYQVFLRDREGKAVQVGKFSLVRPRAAGPTVGTITQPLLQARFGGSIRLVGYDLPQTQFRAGDAVPLTLYWTTDEVLTTRYKVFTHLVGAVWNADGGNFLWGQQDNEPQADQLPTTRWAPGEVIVDRYRIKLAPNAPAGRYQLEVGMYGLLDGARLPAAGGGDAVMLGEVEVE